MPYLYIWIHIPTQKFYIGSRTQKGAHIDDEYICSSDVILYEIQKNKKDWVRIILKQDNSTNILTLEKIILDLLDVINNPLCLNQTNYFGKVEFKSLTNGARTEPLKNILKENKNESNILRQRL